MPSHIIPFCRLTPLVGFNSPNTFSFGVSSLINYFSGAKFFVAGFCFCFLSGLCECELPSFADFNSLSSVFSSARTAKLTRLLPLRPRMFLFSASPSPFCRWTFTTTRGFFSLFSFYVSVCIFFFRWCISVPASRVQKIYYRVSQKYTCLKIIQNGINLVFRLFASILSFFLPFFFRRPFTVALRLDCRTRSFFFLNEKRNWEVGLRIVIFRLCTFFPYFYRPRPSFRHVLSFVSTEKRRGSN